MSQAVDLSLYRPNVGVVLFNADRKVWYGRRPRVPRPHNWQFPQGGVDDGEELYDAALRELAEETGVRRATLLGRTEGWLTYEFPNEVRGSKIGRGWRGQRQVWFALKFDGDDGEIDLKAHKPAEFDAWRWGELGEASKLVVPFKRAVYEQVVSAFAAFA